MVVVNPTNEFEAARNEKQDAARRRVQRLRDVRAQEASIAAETRKAFKIVAEDKMSVLLNVAEGQWTARHARDMAKAGERTAAVLGGVGVAHASADSVRHQQAQEAAANLALWQRGLQHEQTREARATLEQAAVQAEAAWVKAAANARRDHVHDVEVRCRDAGCEHHAVSGAV